MVFPSPSASVMQPGFMLLFAGAAAIYVSSRASVDAITGGESRAGYLAIGLWLPVAVTAIFAMCVNHSEIAMGVVFASSVASLSLVAGVISVTAEPNSPDTTMRLWPTVLPAAMLVFLAGFRGGLNDLHAAVLLIEGVCLTWVWRWNDAPTPRKKVAKRRSIWMRAVQFVLAAALAGIGAWAAVRGILRTSQMSEIASGGLLSAILLGPLLALPMMGVGIDCAHRGESATAISAQIGVVILNICLLLPILIELVHIRSRWRGVAFQPVPFPLAVWRVDVVALIALGLFLLPIAFGRWRLTRMNGLALILGYILYLALTMTLGVQVI